MAAEAERVRPTAQVQFLVLVESPEAPGGFDHAVVVRADVEVGNVVAVANRPVHALALVDRAGCEVFRRFGACPIGRYAAACLPGIGKDH